MISDKQRQWLIIGLILLAVVAGLYYGILGFIRQNNGEVVFNVLPTTAVITIDGKKSGQGSHFLDKGTYKVEVSASGFTTSSRTVEIKEGEKQTYLESLVPNNKEGEDWVSSHEKLYQDYEKIGGVAAQEAGMELREKFPIIDLLPYTEERQTDEASSGHSEAGFTVGYKEPKDDALTITIRADASLSRRLALSKIKSWGYDPANFNIEFVDYEYPLVAAGQSGGQEN